MNSQKKIAGKYSDHDWSGLNCYAYISEINSVMLDQDWIIISQTDLFMVVTDYYESGNKIPFCYQKTEIFSKN